METRHDYIEKLSARVREWDAKIDELKGRAELAKAEVKVRYKQQIVALNEDRDNAKRILSELYEASDTAWKDVRKRAEELLADVKDIFKKAA